MTDPSPISHAEVYTVLNHRPTLWGVPVKIVLWLLMVGMVLVLLWLATAPTVLSKLLGCIALIVGGGAVHLGLRWSGQHDHDYLEVLLRFLTYPPYLGPR